MIAKRWLAAGLLVLFIPIGTALFVTNQAVRDGIFAVFGIMPPLLCVGSGIAVWAMGDFPPRYRGPIGLFIPLIPALISIFLWSLPPTIKHYAFMALFVLNAAALALVLYDMQETARTDGTLKDEEEALAA